MNFESAIFRGFQMASRGRVAKPLDCHIYDPCSRFVEALDKLILYLTTGVSGDCATIRRIWSSSESSRS